MSSVNYDISMSLDGYVRAANPTPDEPLGVGGEVLHDWAMDRDDAAGRDVLERGIAGAGAIATQFLRAGLVDEVSVHVVPFLFGGGTRLTETLPAHIRLELVDHISAPSATHLRYRIKR